MGSSQSARKLTISNEEEVGVIKVSNAVVHRLSTGTSSEAAPGTSGKNVSGTPPVYPVTPAAPVPTPHTGAPPHGHSVYYYPEYTVSALEIQQQKEKELSSQDQYWQRRLQNMEKNHDKVNKIIEAEYKKAVEEISDGEGPKEPIPKGTKPPCVENSNKVLKCYQEHPKEILKCSSLVEEFSNCVDQRRSRLIAARC